MSTNKFPEFSADELVSWLQAKYRQHGEIEDGVAAERLKSLTAEVSVLRTGLENLIKSSQAIIDNRHEDLGERDDVEPYLKNRISIARKALDTASGSQKS